MKEKLNESWLTLNASYYAAVAGNPLDLMDDAYMLLKRARCRPFDARGTSTIALRR
jgi:hypothetical protein